MEICMMRGLPSVCWIRPSVVAEGFLIVTPLMTLPERETV